MYRISISIVVFVVLETLSVNLRAQSTATKTFTENLLINSDDIIRVIGEKANIHVTKSMGTQMQLKVTFKATNKEKSMASKELEYMSYGLFRENNIVQIRNSFMLPANVDHIKSTLEILFEISIPVGQQIEITNKYGYMEIKDFKGALDIDLEFCDLLLDKVAGKANLKTSFSEIHGRDIAFSSLESEDDKSRVFMNIDAGSYLFKSTYGDLNLTLGNIRNVQIESKRTDVVLTPNTFELFDYDLINNGGSIYVPGKYTHLLKREGKKVLFLVKDDRAKPTIQVSTDYNTITIN